MDKQITAGQLQVHFDDALQQIREYCSRLVSPSGQHVDIRQQPGQADLSLWDVIKRHLGQPIQDMNKNSPALQEICRPYYDAAWELCRIGVLRPGSVAPAGQYQGHINNDLYSVTIFGRSWVKSSLHLVTLALDPSRFASVIEQFRDFFGSGFAQRAVEAVRSYRAGNYLSCCAMAGAAAESILLATAISKVGDEDAVLATYRSSRGRDRTMSQITSALRAGLRKRFEAGCDILHYWRDAVTHGEDTQLSEEEAYTSLAQLMRFAIFAKDHWGALTGKP